MPWFNSKSSNFHKPNVNGGDVFVEQRSEKPNTSTKEDTKKMGKSSSKFPKVGDPIFSNPDIYLSPSEIVTSHGFPFETHEVVTADGYILSLFRIPHGEIKPDEISNGSENHWEEIGQEEKRPVALFVHGILMSGTTWLLSSNEKVLPYQLANRGFDCWILNARGCEYSKKHTELSVTSRKFWNFSWADMAEFDVPVVIDYILTSSKQKRLYYIGHSMGCAMLFAAVSLKPELREKVKMMIAFAPAVYIKHATTFFVKNMSKLPASQTLLSSIYHGEFCLRPTVKLMRRVAFWLWIWKKREARDSTWFCLQIMNQVNGSDPEQINWTHLPVVAGHLPSPTSVKTYVHFLQSHKSGEFLNFDYGRSKNLKIYGQAEPPSFDLTKSTFPVGIFYGDNDSCVQPEDAQRLSKELPNVIKCHREKLTHTGFLFAKDVDTLVNDHVIELVMNDLKNTNVES